MQSHHTIKISGMVQGVFFRHSAKSKAEELGLSGYAKNESDGTLLIEVEGEPDELEIFSDWCKIGPTSARVDEAEVVEAPTENYTGFEILG
ncbi:acylphosphatase [Candidatus Uhrbacteria bacterium]|nr:acylphosphatase [Candidatus Uhrbacteria bacterium]